MFGYFFFKKNIIELGTFDDKVFLVSNVNIPVDDGKTLSWDEVTNSWTFLSDVPYESLEASFTLFSDTKGLLNGGFDDANSQNVEHSYIFNVQDDTWKQVVYLLSNIQLRHFGLPKLHFWLHVKHWQWSSVLSSYWLK